MFLHAGASLHGHEYSRPVSRPPAPRRNSLLRAALRPLSDLEPGAKSPPPAQATHQISRSLSVPCTSRPSILRLSQPTNAFPDDDLSFSPASYRPRPTSDSLAPPRRSPSSTVRFRSRTDVPLTNASVSNALAQDSSTFNVSERLVSAGTAPPAARQGNATSEYFASAIQSECNHSNAIADTQTSSTIHRHRPPGRRRVARNSTKFALAQPAPRLITKQRRLVQIRPRLLLQLQQLTDRRPRPAFDVLAAGLIAGPAIAPRLARRFPRVFRLKAELGLDDLVLARSEDYDPSSTSSAALHSDSPALTLGAAHISGVNHRSAIRPNSGSGTTSVLTSLSDDDIYDAQELHLERRDLAAVISPVPGSPNDLVEVVLDTGSVWIGKLIPHHSFEFVSLDSAGNVVTARWVRRSLIRPDHQRSSSFSSTTTTPTAYAESPSQNSSSAAGEYRYTFSVLDPSSRRHPVMATLTPIGLEILDRYSTVSSLSAPTPQSPIFTSTPAAPSPVLTPCGATSIISDASEFTQRASYPVDPATRLLITATAAWVTLRLQSGWPSQSRTACAAAKQQQQTASYSGPTTVVPPKRAVSTGAEFMRRRSNVLSENGTIAKENAPFPTPIETALVPSFHTVARREQSGCGLATKEVAGLLTFLRRCRGKLKRWSNTEA